MNFFRTVKEAGDHMREFHFEELKRIFCKYENCEYYNRKPRDLEFHYVRVHTKEKNFMCDKCDFRAMMAAEIDRHIRQVKTSYSIFRAGSSNKFEIAALLSQPKNITNAIANQITSKRQQFQTCLKILL